jgi:cell wall-associated NlpC family hydrolase
LKYTLFTFLILILFTSCKPASSIITSKDVAVKKGVYSEPVVAKNNATKKTKNKKDLLNKQVVQASDQKKVSGINYKNDADIVIENEDGTYLISQLINSASDNLSVHYRAGGTTAAGFDCSGLLYSTFKKFDITLPRSSYQMAEVGKHIAVENAKKGDLIFFMNKGGYANKK